MRRAISTLLILTLAACGASSRRAETPRPESEMPAVDGTAATAAALSKPPAVRLKYRGTNLSGGEFGQLPGVVGRDYGFPKPEDARYFVERGMNFFRIPFRHERLQPTTRAPLDDEEWARMMVIVDAALAMGATVAIEPHNSGRHNGRIISTLEMGDLWGRIANRVKTRPDVDRIWMNLTNEPHDMTTETWVSLANAGIRELRRVGYNGTVLVPGNGWTGGGHWSSSWYGTPNSKAMLGVTDPANNLVFEVHQYLDSDASGGKPECVSATIGVERLTNFIEWLRANGKRGFLGEIGAPNTPLCKEAVTRTLAFVEEHYDVWVGWTWWSAGYRWTPNYPLSIQPLPSASAPDGERQDRPQLMWLRPFLPAICGR